ncbi:hypothetical protein B0H63DRAFT_464794 [Podospora didyma]|uniref:Uncharacterized protein n=1 Tax=Podospora didyma TaxID=330526 RepID=A0AAE0NZ87_9PEZI|nr:hypothetical protein B0H63DRAFT_464794 [Podospora didyma]
MDHSLTRRDQSGKTDTMLDGYIYMIIILFVIWSLASVCVALYYINLLPQEARRRWPVVEREGCFAFFVPALLFLFAFCFWPAIAMWDFCARYCEGSKTCCGMGPGGYCCVAETSSCCGPCISNEVHMAERMRRREAHIRLQQAFVVANTPPPRQTMEPPPYYPAFHSPAVGSRLDSSLPSLVSELQGAKANEGHIIR